MVLEDLQQMGESWPLHSQPPLDDKHNLADQRQELLFHFGTGFFGVAPLATVISFILFPAHQRIVFEAGVNLAWKAFFAAFIRLMVPWAAEREFVRQVLRNISEDGLSNADSGRLASLGGDEL